MGPAYDRRPHARKATFLPCAGLNVAFLNRLNRAGRA
jgi:hypothetical protein